jgi:hypothetical protein
MVAVKRERGTRHRRYGLANLSDAANLGVMRRTTARVLPALFVILVTLGSGSATQAVDVSPSRTDVDWKAWVNARDVEHIDEKDPVELSPAQRADVRLIVANGGDEELLISSVKLDGRVVGLTFFSYTTRVDLKVPPKESRQRRISIDLADLESQATGRLPARLALLGEKRQVVQSWNFTVDFDGAMLSVYGVLGLAVAASTAVLLLLLLFQLATGRLPVNRWRRATRFGIVGIGLGLTAAFTLSVFTISAPNRSMWMGSVGLFGLVAFALGYVSPAPTRGEDVEERPTEYGDEGEEFTIVLPDAAAPSTVDVPDIPSGPGRPPEDSRHTARHSHWPPPPGSE